MITKAAAQEREVSERIYNEKERLVRETLRNDTERVKFLVDVYQETEGEPPVMRRAKLFDRMCRNKTIFIDDNPLVGTLTRFKLGSFLQPDTSCRWMKKFPELPTHMGTAPFAETEEDVELINRAIEYWNDKCAVVKGRARIIEATGVDPIAVQWGGVWTGVTLETQATTAPDMSLPLTMGLRGMIDWAKERKSLIAPTNITDTPRWHFYNAVIICLEALIELGNRYSSLAREMSGKETDPERKKELERIAETCAWVPANPPRDFYEALQMVWFIQLGLWIENPIIQAPPGRFPQYMYPFYRKDKNEGKLDDEQTIEFIQWWYLKQQGLANALYHPRTWEANSPSLRLHLALGGYTPDGRDATNELDFLLLEAKRRMPIPEPHLLVMYHPQLSQEFWFKCVELIRTGTGQPAFFNADLTLARHLHNQTSLQPGWEGVTLEEARDCAIAGCIQAGICGKTHYYWEVPFNTAKMVELALNNGADPLSGKQIGPRTGEAEKFASYDEFYQAVRKQLEYFLALYRKSINISWSTFAEMIPVPFGSAFVHDCIRDGKDQVEGGARYTSLSGAVIIGVIDLANSLAAVKKLVFEDKRITMRRLKEALAVDFEGDGDAEIQLMCLKAPKYGNDEEYADSVVTQCYSDILDIHSRDAKNFEGRYEPPVAFSLTAHVERGRYTGALPSGRKAKVALTDATVSAQPGTDRNGPTALVKSAARAMDGIKWGGNHFNVKFHPAALKGTEGASKLMALTKTYMDMGGYHIQYNCISSETLKDAQLHPDDYRDLVVRVAGFSAYFIYLDRDTQNELILRTEQSF